MPWLSLLLNWRVWAGVGLTLLVLAVGVQTHRLKSAKSDLVSLQTKFDVFKDEVESVGKRQEESNKLVIANQERVSRETSTNYQHRLDIINDEYRRLRDKGNPSSSQAAPVSTAPAPVDDTARNAELLAVLRQAEVQTNTLIELQNWVKGVSR